MALLAAATLYGIGKSFFWGTSLAVASEQFPRGGAIMINLIGGTGMLAGGIMSALLLGAMQDGAVEKGLRDHDKAYGTRFVERNAADERQSVFGEYKAPDRVAVAKAPMVDRSTIGAIEADSRKQVLKAVALLPLFMLFCYLAMILYFRHRGGYAPVNLREDMRTESVSRS